MRAFYILKPDMINRSDVMDYYNGIIDNLSYIENREKYIISSWVDLSCLLYEPWNSNLTLDELKKIRSQMLTTIKGYDYLYNGGYAIVDIFDIPNDMNILRELEDIKYKVRREFVLNTDKNYFMFEDNIDKLCEQELRNIDINSLNVSHIRLNYDEDIGDSLYKMAFFNCIHFPDPNEGSILRDMEIIDRSKLLIKKI